MTVIMNQEPTTQEGMAFSFVKFANIAIMGAAVSGSDENWKSGSGSGRLLSSDEQTVYDVALGTLKQFFGTGTEWRFRPTNSGLYALTHLDQARLELVIVFSDGGYRTLYDVADQTRYFVDDIRGLWLGPLPMSPVIKKENL